MREREEGVSWEQTTTMMMTTVTTAIMIVVIIFTAVNAFYRQFKLEHVYKQGITVESARIFFATVFRHRNHKSMCSRSSGHAGYCPIRHPPISVSVVQPTVVYVTTHEVANR